MQLFTIRLEYNNVSIMNYNLERRVFIYNNFVKYKLKQNIWHEIGEILKNCGELLGMSSGDVQPAR